MYGCKGQTKSGEPCRAPVLKDGLGFCYTHAPHIQEERSAARRRAGLALHYGGAGHRTKRPKVVIRSVSDVLQLLERAASDLLCRKPSVTRARTLAYVSTAALAAVRESNLEERVAALEARLNVKRIS